MKMSDLFMCVRVFLGIEYLINLHTLSKKKKIISILLTELRRITRDDYYMCVIAYEYNYCLRYDFTEFFEYIEPDYILDSGRKGLNKMDYRERIETIDEFLKLYPQFKPKNYKPCVK